MLSNEQEVSSARFVAQTDFTEIVVSGESEFSGCITRGNILTTRSTLFIKELA
jgi:hypothetical protein